MRIKVILERLDYFLKVGDVSRFINGTVSMGK